jgi:3-isopropylmalate/(R)-2-methylmalate dehydratase small subunit
MKVNNKGGKAWIFGYDIDTDVLAPGLYMKGSFEELASHCLEAIDPDFASNVAPGDVVVAGKNFGVGSSREQAAEALKYLGVSILLAKSFAGIFFRNALNFGMIALTC